MCFSKETLGEQLATYLFPRQQPGSMHLAERQGNIRIRSAVADLALTRGHTIRPFDRRAIVIVRCHRNRLALERVTEYIRQIVPDTAVLQAQGEVGLRAAVEEAAFHAGDLEGDAAGDWVAAELLTVAIAGVDGFLGPDVFAHRPEVYGLAAVIFDDGVADGVGERGEGSQGGKGELGEMHDCFLCGLVWFCLG